MLTGKNLLTRYYRHTAIRSIKSNAKKIFRGKTPEGRKLAVQRMVPKGPGRQQMTNLKIYKGGDHPHEAQKPEVLDIASMNKKNKRSA